MPSPALAPRQLIVTADDFGISRGVNRGVVDAHRHGLVTGASLMPNLPAAEDAVTLAAGCPDLRLGLHLTLTAGRPLSPPERVPTLVRADGRFHVLGRLLARLSLGLVSRADLQRELAAQLSWALDRGIHPAHLDSHHHVHTHPRLAALVTDLAAAHGIRQVRCPAEGVGTLAPGRTRPRDALRTIVISLGGARLRRLLRSRGLETSDHFRGIALGTGFGTPALLRTLRELPAGLTELMTHPGHPDAELARQTDFVAGRDRELAALTAPAALALVRTLRIELTGARLTSRHRP